MRGFQVYTTPEKPYDIRYKVVIKQDTRTSGIMKQGLELHTVVDGTLNPWDMDPDQGGRQTKGTWEFGVASHGPPNPKPTRRRPTEVYE